MRQRHLSLLVLVLVLLGSITAACATTQAATTQQAIAQEPASQLSALDVATHYFNILNAGVKSANFADLSSVFASDATFTRSTLDGKSTVYHGLTEITSFYTTLPGKVPDYQWTTDSIRSLSPTVVIAYEHAGTLSMKVPSRCTHIFVVQNGKIVSYDWVVFFAGVK